MNNYNNNRSGGFNKNRGGSDRGGFGGGRNHGGGHRGGGNKFGGGRDDRPKEMHSATCATCQKSCQVPFRPSGDKPVFCSDCFSKQNDGDRDSRRGDRGGDSRPKFGSSSIRAEHPNDRKQAHDSELKQRLATIEAKLNKILDIINPPTKSEKKAEKVKVKKEVDMPALKDAVARATSEIIEKKKPVKKAVKKASTKKAVAKKLWPRK